MKKKYILFIVALVLITLFAASAFYIIKQNRTNAVEAFYNEGLVISVKTFLRINGLPITADTEDPAIARTEVDGYFAEYKKLKTIKGTEDGKKLLGSFFEESYVVLDLVEKYYNRDPNVRSLDILTKLSEVQTLYLDYSKSIDSKKIPVTVETIEAIKEITLEYLNP